MNEFKTNSLETPRKNLVFISGKWVNFAISSYGYYVLSFFIFIMAKGLKTWK